ncbi:VOC family protein [Halovulum sp. GXIMD14793]
MARTEISKGIQGIYETHLPVRDLSRSVAFYRDQLGLTLATSLPERKVAFFWIGGKGNGMLGLWESGSGPLWMSLHFAFRSTKDMLLRSCQELKAVGIDPLGFHGEPVSEPVVIGWMPALSIYFKDPDGHSVEMLHVLDEEADPGFGVKSNSAWISRTRR